MLRTLMLVMLAWSSATAIASADPLISGSGWFDPVTGATYNPYTKGKWFIPYNGPPDSTMREYNPWTGAASREAPIFNPYTGRYQPGKVVFNPYTGRHVMGFKLR